MTDSRSSETTRRGAPTTARRRAIDAYGSARGTVADAGRRAADTLTEAPLIAVAGGLAAGALIAALLPGTDAEENWVRPAARRVRKSASAAFEAARTTGTQRLGEVGLSRQKGEEAIRSVLDRVTDVAKASAEAATNAAKNAN